MDFEMRKDDVYFSNNKLSFTYINMKDVAYYYMFVNGKLYCESYINLNGDEHNLFGAALITYEDNTVKVLDKYYYINKKTIKVENDLEFSEYVKGLVLK
jgi:hypothetical protein